MRRRALLSTTGATLAGLAGCLSGSSDDGPAAGTDPTNTTDAPTDTPTQTDDPTSTEPAEPAVELSLLSYQPAVVQLATDSIHVSDEGGPFLFLDVDASAAATPPARDEFMLRHGDVVSSPVDPDDGRLWRQYHEDGSYGDGNERGWLLFEVSESMAAEHVRVSCPGGVWRPDAALRDRLSTEYPPMSMAVSVPETVGQGEHPTVSVTVENQGDVDACFVAALNRVGPRVAYTPAAAASFVVPAGGTEIWEHTGDFDTTPLGDDELGDGQHDLTYHLNSVLGSESRQVSYVADDS